MRLPVAFANKRIGALDSLLLRICRKLGIGKTVRQVQQVVLKKKVLFVNLQKYELSPDVLECVGLGVLVLQTVKFAANRSS